jgi:hypothetical protein
MVPPRLSSLRLPGGDLGLAPMQLRARDPQRSLTNAIAGEAPVVCSRVRATFQRHPAWEFADVARGRRRPPPRVLRPPRRPLGRAKRRRNPLSARSPQKRRHFAPLGRLRGLAHGCFQRPDKMLRKGSLPTIPKGCSQRDVVPLAPKRHPSSRALRNFVLIAPPCDRSGTGWAPPKAKSKAP